MSGILSILYFTLLYNSQHRHVVTYGINTNNIAPSPSLARDKFVLFVPDNFKKTIVKIPFNTTIEPAWTHTDDVLTKVVLDQKQEQGYEEPDKSQSMDDSELSVVDPMLISRFTAGNVTARVLQDLKKTHIYYPGDELPYIRDYSDFTKEAKVSL